MTASTQIPTIAETRAIFVDIENKGLAILGPCPPELKESTIDIPLADGSVSKTIIVRPNPSSTPTSAPLVVLFHGGHYSYSTPAMALTSARGFAAKLGAVVALPSYKLTPEHPFPAPQQSGWEAAAWLSGANGANINKLVLKDENVTVDLALGFILGGISAGSGIAAAIAGVAAAVRAGEEGRALIKGLPDITSPITGLYLAAPHLVNEEMLPSELAYILRSRVENASAPVLDIGLVRSMEERLAADYSSPWFSPLNLPKTSLSSGTKSYFPAKVYLQCGGLDVLRDDAVVFAKALRDGKVAESRLDKIDDMGHVAWLTYPFPDCHRDDVKEKSLNGMAWMLEREWEGDMPW
ncbi:Alpha/Beta hydrolase protein [Xylariaceae sp. FL0016]|nr:Alpha/Beta hydrolase protein [Xylariaceae sp. FL0016]